MPAATTPVSQDIQNVVKQYIQEILANPTLEDEEPAQFEQYENHGQPPMEGQIPQQQPSQGAF